MVDLKPRLAVFIDRQNVYNGARDTFQLGKAFHTRGQTNPLKVSQLIAKRVVDGTDRQLTAVRIYRGMPDARKSPKPNAAALRQNAAWQKLAPDFIEVISRPLRYPYDWPTTPAQEKGIDVQLAIDFVLGYIRHDFDVGVLFSADTDLLPALEAAYEIQENFEGLLKPEVAAWGDRSRSSGRRLRPTNVELHCHWLGPLDFKECSDDTDYNIRP